MLAGVCGGAAKLLGVDAAIVRLLLVAATLLGFGTGALVYLACWIVVPEEGSDDTVCGSMLKVTLSRAYLLP